MALIALLSLTLGRYELGDSRLVWLVAETPNTLQKTFHIIFYGTLTLLLLWTLAGLQSRIVKLLTALTLAVAFGIVMEWGQTMVPGRFGTLFDVLLNSAGIFLGLLASIFLHRNQTGLISS